MQLFEINHVDETYIKLHAERSIMMDLKDTFSFFTPGYKFHPKFRAGIWDGRISLINYKNNTMYKGLLPDLVAWLDERKIAYEIEPRIFTSIPSRKITTEQVYEFYQRIGGIFKPHDSQVAAFEHCVNNGRSIILAPTNNGKSYVMHGLNAFYTMQKKRVLMIVDRANLVMQLKDNFVKEYKAKYPVSDVYESKAYNTPYVYITTWQSCYKNDPTWFKKFDVLIGDEVHKFKATSLKAIIDNCGHIEDRHGFTATLDNDSKSDRLTLIGMFGTPVRVSTVRQDIENGISARPTVYAIVRRYSNDAIKAVYLQHGEKTDRGWKLPFQNEVKYLENDPQRNHLIANLRTKLNGHTMIAFKRADHGKAIVQALKDKNVESTFINYTVNKNVRHDFSSNFDSHSEQQTAVCSLGTFGTGINIKSLNNLIIACQILSSINVPQLIGRMIRTTENKKTVDIYDIGDDLTYRKIKNATFKHFEARIQMYLAEGFEVKMIYKDVD